MTKLKLCLICGEKEKVFIQIAEKRGYQTKPDGNFGYQPLRATSKPPAPPTSGSNAVKPKSDK